MTYVRASEYSHQRVLPSEFNEARIVKETRRRN